MHAVLLIICFVSANFITNNIDLNCLSWEMHYIKFQGRRQSVWLGVGKQNTVMACCATCACQRKLLRRGGGGGGVEGGTPTHLFLTWVLWKKKRKIKGGLPPCPPPPPLWCRAWYQLHLNWKMMWLILWKLTLNLKVQWTSMNVKALLGNETHYNEPAIPFKLHAANAAFSKSTYSLPEFASTPFFHSFMISRAAAT